MGRLESARRLIVNADDFGLSHSVNQAVIQAHRDGILTTASLMVNEPGFAEAVALAKENPRLGVGLHLTFSHGHSALPPAKIPGLVNTRGEFSNNPAGTGFRYFMRRHLREQLRAEIHAQFEKFRSTGLVLDHVNGHLHFHMHPTIFGILMAETKSFGIQRMRLTRDPFWLNSKLARGAWLYRINHAWMFSLLAARSRKKFHHQGIRHTDKVFGLLQNARVDEPYISNLLPVLPAGDSELYSHPSLDEFRNEFEALISPKVKRLVQQLGIQLIRYQDL
ncbi:MAG: Hopanoid biosynthesis associated protein HpnK [Pedosphaera sp.]|nr:Hopanoid biosynthesis associated protein HpnK [Pedosphaera sp.]